MSLLSPCFSVRGPPRPDNRMTATRIWFFSIVLTRLAKIFRGVYRRVITRR